MVEIAPAFHLDPHLRTRLTSDSVKLAKQVKGRALGDRISHVETRSLFCRLAPSSCRCGLMAGGHWGPDVGVSWAVERPKGLALAGEKGHDGGQRSDKVSLGPLP